MRIIALAIAVFALSSSSILVTACGDSASQNADDAGAPAHDATTDTSAADAGASGDDASTGDAGANDDGACARSTAGGVGDNDAGYGCGDAGLAGFCDNGVRQEPPTCDPTIDALLKRTPLACADKNSKHAYNLDSDSADPDSKASRTADMCNLKGAVYWVADMDVDCDGKKSTHCPGTGADMDQSWQNNTYVQGNNGALTSENTPYVVIPNDNYDDVPDGAVVAVIYGTKLVFAIFGDTGPKDIIGEGSYALAKALGLPPSPANGGVLGNTVTYIAFTSKDAVADDIEDRAQVDALGKQLVDKLLQDNP